MMASSGKKCALCLVGAAFFGLMGWGVRQAEFNAVGDTNDTSLWVFFIAGVFVYAALFILIRGHLKSRR